MEQTPIFVTVEKDLGIKGAVAVRRPYEFAKHDAAVRRRIAARKAGKPAAAVTSGGRGPSS